MKTLIFTYLFLCAAYICWGIVLFKRRNIIISKQVDKSLPYPQQVRMKIKLMFNRPTKIWVIVSIFLALVNLIFVTLFQKQLFAL